MRERITWIDFVVGVILVGFTVFSAATLDTLALQSLHNENTHTADHFRVVDSI